MGVFSWFRNLFKTHFKRNQNQPWNKRYSKNAWSYVGHGQPTAALVLLMKLGAK